MFKFFRKYNKYILAIGGSILMVSFLIGTQLQSCVSGGGNYPIGKLADGTEVLITDRNHAANQLYVLENQFPILGLMSESLLQQGEDQDRALVWYLIQEDAKRLGISASEAEAVEVLGAIGADEDVIRQAGNRVGSRAAVIDAVKSWIIAEAYSEVVLGKSHTSLFERMAIFQQIVEQYMQMPGISRELLVAYAGAVSSDPYRVSKPLIAHYLQDENARVGGKAFLVPSKLYLDDVSEPSDAALAELFEKYKNDLPGQGKPFGFGYKIPDRVKLEYVEIPLESAMKQVKVSEADAYAFYQKNPDAFKVTEEQAKEDPKLKVGETRLYAEVRSDILEGLKFQKANELCHQIAKNMQAAMNKPLSALPREKSYVVFNDQFEQKPLREAADEMKAQFGVTLQVYNFRDRWTNVDQLQTLPGIGMSFVAGRQGASFPLYVTSSKTLNADFEKNPLSTMYLQVGTTSAPMQGYSGSMYVFRLTAAEAAHAPAGPGAVREQLVKDAREEAAYKKLIADKDKWITLAKQNGLDAAAKEADVSVTDLGLVPRVMFRQGIDASNVPMVPGFGESEPLIEALYAVAKTTGKSGDLSEMAAADRTGEAPVQQKRGLAVFRVDEFTLMTETEYAVDAASYWKNAMAMNSTVFADEQTTFLNEDMLKDRVGYQSLEREEDIESSAPGSEDAPEAGETLADDTAKEAA
ncbi:hypothetical protein [Poriferisphaera sp. WC338]|uniref:hypothetical protein n=1 Tax=Poriferisphaera sp. WC338 TaxID=3425129 RepID=UPI003D81A02B